MAEARQSTYLENRAISNTNSGIRRHNDPFLDRAFVVEKLESELENGITIGSSRD